VPKNRQAKETMKTERDYRALQASLQAEEKASGKYLTDECIDRENVLVDGRADRDADFWDRMYACAISSAQSRREE
jgi:hypothetical protein